MEEQKQYVLSIKYYIYIKLGGNSTEQKPVFIINLMFSYMKKQITRFSMSFTSTISLVLFVCLFLSSQFHLIAQTVSGGAYHSLFNCNNGTLKSSGANYFGELGNNTTNGSLVPVPVSNISNVISVAAGDRFSLALKADGTVWSWGYNNLGQLGDGTFTDRHTPVQVNGLSGILKIKCGFGHSFAIKSDGTVWAWGYNSSGQLGDGTVVNKNTPLQISSLTGIADLACGGDHSLALKNDGTVLSWGANTFGQLGDNSNTSHSTPTALPLTGIIAIAGGYDHSVALKNDGKVWAWGNNIWGALGYGSSSSQLSPVQISSISNVIAISAGYYFSLALKNDGTVWVSGAPYVGGQSTPIQLSGISNVSELYGAITGYHAFAIKNDGTLWVWGRNMTGQFANGNSNDNPVPSMVNSGSVCNLLTSTDKVEQNQIQSLQIFPNPSNGMINISSNKMTEGEFIIYNTSGEIVYSIYGNVNEINLSSQPDGIYCIVFKKDKETSMSKILLIK